MRNQFLEMVEEEGVATQEALSRLLQKADKLLAVLKSPARVDAIAQRVAERYPGVAYATQIGPSIILR
jgi:hypothetical protein